MKDFHRSSMPEDPAPPEPANPAWKKLVPGDLEAIVELARDCLLQDGGLPFLFEPDLIQSRYFPDGPGTVIGAFAPDGRLAACAAVHLVSASDPPRAAIVGLVRPDHRRKGVGAHLLDWSQAQAKRLLAGAAATGEASSGRAPNGVMQIQTESLSEPAHRLYLAHGFACVFEEQVMRFDLRAPLPDDPLPQDVTFTPWTLDRANEFYQAYVKAFRERPGFPGWSAAEWIGHVTENDHIPDWSLLALVNGQPAGFVIGNIDLTTDPPGGYVWQIGVVPDQRRRGLASALLAESMRRMRAAGSLWAYLLVHVNNPGAHLAYARLGFTDIGRRARYERAAD
jgi:mycothiol synthase